MPTMDNVHQPEPAHLQTSSLLSAYMEPRMQKQHVWASNLAYPSSAQPQQALLLSASG